MRPPAALRQAARRFTCGRLGPRGHSLATAFAWVLLGIPTAPAQSDPAGDDGDQRRLEAVIRFADNVLEHGRDGYGPEPTPLLVDGVHVDTLDGVRWVDQGQPWVPSNLASQQNLFRTLVGLSRLTDEARYRRAAEQAIAYHFDQLRSPCGLLYWGGHRFIDLKTQQVAGEQNSHELKFNLPYYELMWEVNRDGTEQFIKAFWNAHVLDWGSLDMNRHGKYGKSMGQLWDSEFDPPPPFFEARGLTFANCGGDLIYAAGMLYLLTGDAGALRWAKRLAKQYVRGRHPDTGLGVYQYSKVQRRREPPPEGPLPTTSNYGDRAENQFGAEFGEVAREGYLLRSPDSIYGHAAILQLQLAEQLGDDGDEFLQWTVDGLKACAKHMYDAEQNQMRPMWADGTDLSGYEIQRSGYYGKAGRKFQRRTASSLVCWSFALAHRLSGEPVLWETARRIARGHGLGDLGSTPGRQVEADLETSNADPLMLYVLLETMQIEDSPQYRQLARRIGDNIVRRRFHNGFFLPSGDHINANFNAVEPLALLALEAQLRGQADAVPRYNSGRGYIHGPHDGLGRTTDSTAIWGKQRK